MIPFFSYIYLCVIYNLMVPCHFSQVRVEFPKSALFQKTIDMLAE